MNTRVSTAASMRRRGTLLLCLAVALHVGVVSALCTPRKRPVCVKTVEEPYFQKVCTGAVACAKISIPCGPPEELFSCAADEFCIDYEQDCTTEEHDVGGNKDDDVDCRPRYRCEWRPYSEIDLDAFSVRCTEYYTLGENETCAVAVAKFFLPLKVFSGFNAGVDCRRLGAGDDVCVHATVEAKKPECGRGRCNAGERCVHTECAWRPRYGGRCGGIRCPRGYACRQSPDPDCDEDAVSYERFSLDLLTSG